MDEENQHFNRLSSNIEKKQKIFSRVFRRVKFLIGGPEAKSNHGICKNSTFRGYAFQNLMDETLKKVSEKQQF